MLNTRRILFLLYYAFALFFTVGLATHVSDKATIFWFTKGYFAGLVVFMVVFLVAVPWFLVRFVGKHGLKTLAFSIVPAFLLLLLVYVIAHFRHYAKEEYRFDPFVQVPTARVDTSILNKPGLFILCLGGSTTRGVELKPGEDYPAQLQLLLHQTYPDIPVTVFNAGIPWYTSRHSLINT